jgi:hypothetical protein
MRRTSFVAGAAFGFACGAFGQAAATRPAFEVVSVKADTVSQPGFDAVPRRSGNRVVMHNSRINMIVSYAYSITNPPWQLACMLNLPGSDDASWFDIEAIAPAGSDDAQVQLMFQTLLEDRFHLKVPESSPVNERHSSLGAGRIEKQGQTQSGASRQQDYGGWQTDPRR